ncbi:PilZ domain-containing protein [Methylobacterium oryzisoli]|uniref:PilZ domain-containing protein n=1 Tax=Methylobacterium oryzisoli TaxID=3385502 RepID=UPI0038929E8A
MSERRATQRHQVILPALCWSRSRPDFYAVTIDLSTEGIRLRSAIVPFVDEDLICSIRHIGTIETKVTRTEDQDFAVRVLNRRLAPRTVAKKLLFLAEQQRPGLEAVRVHPRVAPLRTEVPVTLEDGHLIVGRLLNVSASGAGLLLGVPLRVGATIILGSRPARVMRCFAGGVGAAFHVPLDPHEVTEAIVL